MQIIDNSNSYPNRFEEVRVGECFIDGEDGSVCMRIQSPCESYDFNAVTLDRGQPFYRDCGDAVRRVKAVVEVT